MWKKKRAKTMPVWDGHSDPIKHLDNLEKFLADGQVAVWRENGMSEAEISRLAPTEIAQLRARFDQWRAETRARLSMRSG